MNGMQLKQEGQTKALKRAGSWWLEKALIALRSYCGYVYHRGCGEQPDITIDEFRATRRCPEPANPNAWGALPRAAVKAGYLKPTDRVEKAMRPQAQARVIRVWAINPDAL